MARYSYCYGIVKDDNWMEQECERRDDCAYYHMDNMRRFYGNPDYEMFYPPQGECPHFLSRIKEGKKEITKSPFD